MHREFSTLLRIHSQQWAVIAGIALDQFEPIVDTFPYPEVGDLASTAVFELARLVLTLMPDSIARSRFEPLGDDHQCHARFPGGVRSGAGASCGHVGSGTESRGGGGAIGQFTGQGAGCRGNQSAGRPD